MPKQPTHLSLLVANKLAATRGQQAYIRHLRVQSALLFRPEPSIDDGFLGFGEVNTQKSRTQSPPLIVDGDKSASISPNSEFLNGEYMSLGYNDRPESAETVVEDHKMPDEVENIGSENDVLTPEPSEVAVRPSVRTPSEIVDGLLAKNPNIDVVKKKTGRTWLMTAVVKNDSDMVNELLSRGADVNASGTNGFTALMLAVYNNNVEMAQTLLAAGADINHRAQSGSTALDLVDGTNMEMMQLLVEAQDTAATATASR